MTDLGRGYGSQPWHPAEPGYGEQPQQAAPGGPDYVPQDPYATGQYPAQAQEQYLRQQQGYVPADPYQQQWQQQPQPQPQPGPQPPGGYQPYPPQGGYQQQTGYAPQPGYPQQGAFPQQQGMPQQGAFPQQQSMPQQAMPQQAVPQQAMPQQAMPQQGFPQQQFGRPIPQQQPVAAPIPQQQAAPAPAPARRRPAGPGPDGIDWEAEAAALDAAESGTAEPYADEQFADGEVYTEEEYTEEYTDEEYAEGEHPEDEYAAEGEQHQSFLGEEDTSEEAQAKRKAKGKKSGLRNSGACLVVALALVGAMGGAAWWGYGFYKKTFGPPADFTGDGSGAVTITIADGASGTDMGNTLLAADVVKSTGAFVNAYGKNPKGNTIQPGTYTLHHEMSGAAAVQLLVDSNGGNALIIPEGTRAADIYTMIDSKLKLQAGSTANVAKTQVNNLGLPAYAQGNPEGFLFPQKYSITPGMQPVDLLKQMVAASVQHYQDLNLDAGAQKIGLQNGYQVIVEASILQREGNNDNDFGKIARVLYNRLNNPSATQGKLQLDTTLQYALGRNNFSAAEREGDKSPYNTYVNKGLPPTPISNPGDAAIQAVLSPTPGDWVYFVAVSPTDTRFDVTFADFKNDVKAYCTAHNQTFDDKDATCNAS
ncbi:endolytic transglycosylase MltG [Kitasatospora sp. LaBMicrA B282]|uniref:endolytic transglycosylase MltG n=1 Tax=Kitasatospora sp. LaBMicrA B282 TaxID=3420949 RepID=UPI003D1102BD